MIRNLLKEQKMRRLIVLILAVITICLTGCGKFDDIRIKDAKVGNVSPLGLKGVTIELTVEIDNPATNVKISDIEADIKHSGKVLGKVTVDPFELNGRTVQKYDLKAKVTLSENASLFDMMALLDKKFIENCQVDIFMKGKLRSGISKTIKETDVPLKKLIEYADKKK